MHLCLKKIVRGQGKGDRFYCPSLKSQNFYLANSKGSKQHSVHV